MEELYYGEALEMCSEDVAYSFEPKVIDKICYFDLSTGKRKIKYRVVVRTAEGQELPYKDLDSLENIRYFDIWGCPDGGMTAADKRRMKYKLQCEASRLSEKMIILGDQGLQFYNNYPVYVFGESVYRNGLKDILFQVRKSYQVKEKKPFSIEEVCKLLTFMPGVTEILFYASLFAVVRPFLWQTQRKPEFITVLVGPSGHLKTSLVRKYAFWLSDSQLQEISFRSGMSVSSMRKRAMMLEGQNMLVDDLHKAYAKYTNDSQKEHLDSLVRLASSQENCANIFVTAESIKDMAIFSAQDRMLQIKINGMKSDELNSYKRRIGSIPNDVMTGIAQAFAEKLTMNYENIIKKVSNEPFFTWNSTNEVTTRIDYHGYFIKLTEELFCEYMCGGSKKVSHHKELIEALEKNKEEQQKVLKEIRREEEPVDVLVALNDIFKTPSILSGMAKNGYIPNGKNYCLYNNNIYLTKEALTYGLFIYLGHDFSLNTVIRELRDSGVLGMDASKASTKKFCNVRHYVLSRPLLELKCRQRESTD